MTLELVPWKGATVPVLKPGVTASRNYSLADYYQWQQEAWSVAGNQYPTMSTGFMTTQGGQPAEPIGNSFIGYCQGLLFGNGPVASVEAKRVEVFSQAPMLFQTVKDGRPGDMYDDESLDLLRAPWVGGTTSDLLGRGLMYADFGGNAYVVIIDDEIVVLRPDYVTIVLEKREHEGGQVGWRQVGIVYSEENSGTSVPFLRGEYAHFAPKIDPLASYRGMSWLTPIVREVMADKSAIEHRLAFQGNAATPNLAVSIPQPLTPDQFSEFVEAMDSQHKGSRNAGKTLYTAGGADVTVIGSSMKEMDFTALLGKSETRIANAAGVPPVVVGFSEGLQGSSLNSGNYESAKRAFADTTCRHLWGNWCGSIQVLFRPPQAGDRLWYEGRDIPFLHEDLRDLATIEQTQATTISSLITAGFVPESAVAAIHAHDMSLLKHSGMVSVQLAPPGDPNAVDPNAVDPNASDSFAGDFAAQSAAPAADQYIDESSMPVDESTRALLWALDVVSRGDWNPTGHPRNPKGSPGGGKFRSLGARVADAVSGADAAHKDPLGAFNRTQLRTAAKQRGLNPSRGVSVGNLKKMLLDDVQYKSRQASELKAVTRPAVKKAPKDILGAGRDPDEALADIRAAVDGPFAGLHVETKSAFVDATRMHATTLIKDKTGAEVGRIHHSIETDTGGLYADIGLFEIDDPNLHGQGFLTAYLSHLEDWYKQSNLDRIELHAGSTVGGFAWPRRGFDFRADKPSEDVMGRLHDLVGYEPPHRSDYSTDVVGDAAHATDLGLDPSFRGVAVLDLNDEAVATANSHADVEGIITGLVAGGTAHPDYSNVNTQYPEVVDVLKRIAAGDWVSAAELTELGRMEHDHGIGADWIGKDVMMGTDYDAVKWL